MHLSIYYYIYIVAGFAMAGVKMEEYKQIHRCFSNKNHIFSRFSSHCKFHTSNFITVSHKLTTVHKEAHAREQEAKDESREDQGGELSMPVIPCSSR